MLREMFGVCGLCVDCSQDEEGSSEEEGEEENVNGEGDGGGVQGGSGQGEEGKGVGGQAREPGNAIQTQAGTCVFACVHVHWIFN